MSSATVAMNRASGGRKDERVLPTCQLSRLRPCRCRSSDTWRELLLLLLLAPACHGAVCMRVLTRPHSACTGSLSPPAPLRQRRTPGAAPSAARGADGVRTAGFQDTRVRLRRGTAPAAMASSTLARLQQNLNLAGIRLFLSVALVRARVCV